MAYKICHNQVLYNRTSSAFYASILKVQAVSLRMMESTTLRSFTAALLLAAVIAVLFNSPPTDAITASDLKTTSKRNAGKYFASSTFTSPYVLVAYLTQAQLNDPKLSLDTVCANPTKGLKTKFPAGTPLHPTYSQIWDLILQKSYYTPLTYNGKDAVTYSAAWSSECFSGRFYLEKPGTYAAQYEQLLAVWMLNAMRDVKPGEVQVILGSRKPCDYGEQADHTERYYQTISEIPSG